MIKTNEQKETHTKELEWARSRRQTDESIILVTCACCKTVTAVFVEQKATTEVVPGTTPAIATLPP